MEKLKTEGIVIHALPFQNYDCILTAFTPHDGLIKLFCRGAYRPQKRQRLGTTEPLAAVDLVYTKGRNGLDSCSEIAVLNAHLPLRQSLPLLEAACAMLQAVSATQAPGKAAPELFHLLLAYLHKLPQAQDPQTIVASFKLKLLRYEGLLAFLSHCVECSALLGEAYVHENEAFCQEHASPGALFFTQEERETVELLAFCRDYMRLAAVHLQPPLVNKISTLFHFEI